jgi:hypothetical protein
MPAKQLARQWCLAGSGKSLSLEYGAWGSIGEKEQSSDEGSIVELGQQLACADS